MRKVFVAVLLLALAVLAHGKPVIYTVQANVRAGLTFPASEGIEKIEYLAPDDKLIVVPLQIAADTVTFTVTPDMLTGGEAILIVNRPPNRDLSDRDPPIFNRVFLDGVETAAREIILIPYQPREVRLEVCDVSGIKPSALRVMINGKRAGAGQVQLDRKGTGRCWLITYRRPDGFGLQSLRVTATDSSLMGNSAAFVLQVEQGLSVVSGDQYSGGQAVSFDTQSAFVAARLQLAAGKYQVEVIAQGTGSATDSFWIELDGTQQADVVHIPVDKPGIGSSVLGVDPRHLPGFTVLADGEHVLVLVLREAPGPVLDCLRILQDGREIAVFEGEALLPAFPKP